MRDTELSETNSGTPCPARQTPSELPAAVWVIVAYGGAEKWRGPLAVHNVAYNPSTSRSSIEDKRVKTWLMKFGDAPGVGFRYKGRS